MRPLRGEGGMHVSCRSSNLFILQFGKVLTSLLEIISIQIISYP